MDGRHVVGFVNGSLPLRVQVGVFGVWMIIALILPIATVVAAVKAAALPFRAPDTRVRLLRPVFGWCLVAVAVTMNVFCYAVGRTRSALTRISTGVISQLDLCHISRLLALRVRCLSVDKCPIHERKYMLLEPPKASLA
jgi:hypothetical protein